MRAYATEPLMLINDAEMLAMRGNVKGALCIIREGVLLVIFREGASH